MTPAEFSRLRFLVVEDHGFQRWAAENVLRSLGAVHVFIAEDGQRALDVLTRSQPPIDLILCDLNMPGMDGIEFIRRAGESGARAGIVLVSEQDPVLMESVAAMVRAYGGDLLRAVSKPITREKLTQALCAYRSPDPARVMPGKPAPFGFLEIDAALRNSEFEPHFQPRFELATRAVRGAEALARWHHARHGIVAAASFMGELESSGRMRPVTEMVIAKATACCRQWRAAGSGATLAVNLSLSCLSDAGLADRLHALVEAAKLNPSDVILEVTETAAATHLGRVLENLSRLRLKGFGLSLDDYGTGYASMQQLARIPFTEIKIDQSFVRHALESPASMAMVESSLEIAAKLGIPAVAEGVESEDQHRLLVAMGCSYGQGFLYARPMPCRDFAQFLRKRAA